MGEGRLRAAVSRHSLTSFASRMRHRIVNNSGMLYQSLGDSVVGLFGVPKTSPGYLEQPVACARGLVGEIVVSNTFYQRLPDTLRAEFQELPPVEAKNIGRIRARKLDLHRPGVTSSARAV